MNLFEHVQNIRSRQNQPTTLDELETDFQEEWNRLPQVNLKRLKGSIHRRMQALVEN